MDTREPCECYVWRGQKCVALDGLLGSQAFVDFQATGFVAGNNVDIDKLEARRPGWAKRILVDSARKMFPQAVYEKIREDDEGQAQDPPPATKASKAAPLVIQEWLTGETETYNMYRLPNVTFTVNAQAASYNPQQLHPLGCDMEV